MTRHVRVGFVQRVFSELGSLFPLWLAVAAVANSLSQSLAVVPVGGKVIDSFDLSGAGDGDDYDDDYADDTFEADDDDDDHRRGGNGFAPVRGAEQMDLSDSLSEIGRSMVQLGLDDSQEMGNPLQQSFELPSGSQLVHMTAAPTGIMDSGRMSGGGAPQSGRHAQYGRDGERTKLRLLRGRK